MQGGIAREAVAIAPDNAFYQSDLAESLFGLRRFQEAINDWQAAAQSFEKAAELNPKDDAAPLQPRPLLYPPRLFSRRGLLVRLTRIRALRR